MSQKLTKLIASGKVLYWIDNYALFLKHVGLTMLRGGWSGCLWTAVAIRELRNCTGTKRLLTPTWDVNFNSASFMRDVGNDFILSYAPNVSSIYDRVSTIAVHHPDVHFMDDFYPLELLNHNPASDVGLSAVVNQRADNYDEACEVERCQIVKADQNIF